MAPARISASRSASALHPGTPTTVRSSTSTRATALRWRRPSARSARTATPPGSAATRWTPAYGGNWAHEAAALLATAAASGAHELPGRRRRCVDGTVLIHDVPVAETAYGATRAPREPSSRPEATCERRVAARRSRAWRRRGSTRGQRGIGSRRYALPGRGSRAGRLDRGIAAYPQVRALRPAAPPTLPRPSLVLCGSLHRLSRSQIAALAGPSFGPGDHDAIVALRRVAPTSWWRTPPATGGDRSPPPRTPWRATALKCVAVACGGGAARSRW